MRYSIEGKRQSIQQTAVYAPVRGNIQLRWIQYDQFTFESRTALTRRSNISRRKFNSLFLHQIWLWVGLRSIFLVLSGLGWSGLSDRNSQCRNQNFSFETMTKDVGAKTGTKIFSSRPRRVSRIPSNTVQDFC